MTIDDETLRLLSQRFVTFAEQECAGYEPLYEVFSYGIAGDPELLRLAARSRQGQPPPNLIFGAVQYLLLDDLSQPLARYYASLNPQPLPPQDAFAAFRDFCLAHYDAIAALLETRIVQTNEVGRSACLLPAFSLVEKLGGDRRLALVEVGPSAGLNLLFDRYFIDYGSQTWGDPASPVHLTCELKSELPQLQPGRPQIGYRIGVDLNPIDVRDADAVHWLRALVWPQIPERSRTLREALELAREDPPVMLRGDAVEMLPNMLAQVQADLTLCVFQSHVMRQLSPEAHAAFDAILQQESMRRPVFDINKQDDYATFGVMHSRIDLTCWSQGQRTDRLLALGHSHGRWLDWRDPAWV